ncbi:7-alpha-hydroxycholest-4-en-3-one 12-alpha-hydroxylase [Talaromyces islandicus]|uniref:7-alpha-hydroxycholest-4-en-3-one 12-alpha-hydroxylase n=1 Tax=Talaromyces islandicus TaxID=28573 RepID=A0A0U1LSL9_TALIS|nr:7-alpha-hydroxycholest-4-en-3-one 12-alpha-hydroxylase [Talaromyces islandicus]
MSSEISPIQGFISVLVAIVLIVASIARLNGVDSREPPAAKPTVPLLGHVFGLLWNGTAYFQQLCDKNPNIPAITIPIFKAKTYIITAPWLLQAVQRNSRIISFDPFLSFATDRIAGCSKHAQNILREKPAGGQGGNHNVIHAMHPTLLGDGLDDMNESMIKRLKLWNDALAARAPMKIDLCEWCREVITVAASESMWGELNPFKSKVIRDAFWDFEGGMNALLLKFLPQLTARRGWKGRETLFNAFVEYYKADGTKSGSQLAKARWNCLHEMGVSLEDIARLETSMCIGLLANTVPTAFWFLFDVCSRPEILEKIRGELYEHAVHIDPETKSAIVDLADIREHCPFIIAALQESLRTRNTGRATRLVYEDVVIDNKYLLKKGSIIQIPYQAVHEHEKVWGSTSKNFDPTRFLNRTQRKVGGFLEFGMSPNTCPGRHFAAGEILSFVAALILRFDLTPTISSPGAPWNEPEIQPSSVVTSFAALKNPLLVSATPREKYQDYDWDFRVTRGSGRFELIMG